jgi:hypothetical protein
VCCPYRALVVLSCVGVSVPLEAVNININIKLLRYTGHSLQYTP